MSQNRYRIYAKRPTDKQWSEWSETNDIRRVIEFVDNIRALGYLADVRDVDLKHYQEKTVKKILKIINKQTAYYNKKGYRDTAARFAELEELIAGKFNVSCGEVTDDI